MAGEIVGFYDGSTSKDGKRITPAGYAAKPEVWREVEAGWARVLANDTNRPKAKSLHMWQANSLDEEFSVAKGWDKAKIDSLLKDLSNECLSPYGIPALVAPAGQDHEGLPIGVQMIGPRWSEMHLLNVCRALESVGALPGFRPPPNFGQDD